MWLGGEKEKRNGVCSSNQKGHKNRGFLLKSMDYIIEWNAPSPVYGSQASRWLFPASVAGVVRVHARVADFRHSSVLDCFRLFKWISYNAQ